MQRTSGSAGARRAGRPFARAVLLRAATVLVLVFAAIPLATPQVALAAASPAREAFDFAAQDLDLQIKLPGQPQPVPPSSLSIPTDIVSLLVYAAVIAGAIVIALVLRDITPAGFLRRRARETGLAEQERAVADGVQAKIRRRADELAAEGLYAEAIHVLLLETLAELRQRSGAPVATSLTSREILRRAALPEEPEGALRSIIDHSEWVHFGGFGADAADYAKCRDRFDIVSRAVVTRRAA